MNSEKTGYWTFFCNPKYWEVDKYLRKASVGQKMSYFINKNHKNKIKQGEFGILRVGYDTRSKKQLNGEKKIERGIYAIFRILRSPYLKKGTHGKEWIKENERNFNRYIVDVEIVINYIENPILFDELESKTEIIEDKYLIKGIPSATMPLSPLAFDKILLLRE